MLILDPTLQPFEISIENVPANRIAQEILLPSRTRAAAIPNAGQQLSRVRGRNGSRDPYDALKYFTLPLRRLQSKRGLGSDPYRRMDESARCLTVKSL